MLGIWESRRKKSHAETCILKGEVCKYISFFPLCVFVGWYACVHIRMWGLRLKSGSFFSHSSTLSNEAVSLRQSQSSPIWLVSSLCWGCPVYTFRAWNYSWATTSANIYVDSGVLEISTLILMPEE